MIHELCITLMMRAAALGHTLYESQCLAVLALLQLVLICTLLGHRMVLKEDDGCVSGDTVPVRSDRFVDMRGIFPVISGTAVRCNRAFLRHS